MLHKFVETCVTRETASHWAGHVRPVATRPPQCERRAQCERDETAVEASALMTRYATGPECSRHVGRVRWGEGGAGPVTQVVR